MDPKFHLKIKYLLALSTVQIVLAGSIQGTWVKVQLGWVGGGMAFLGVLVVKWRQLTFNFEVVSTPVST